MVSLVLVAFTTPRSPVVTNNRLTLGRTTEFYEWLKRSSRSYEAMEKEVSQILGFRWYALNDKQYKLTPININIPYYYEGFEENC